MKKLKSFLVAGFVTFLVVCFLGTADLAAECGAVDNEPVATVMIGSSGIYMSPLVSYASIVVNVSRPDGVIFRKVFQSGSTPYIGLSDLGDKYPDGVYKYELRVISSPNMKVRQESDFSSVDKGISQKALTQSGSFMVQGGSIMATGGVQETPARTLDVLHYDDVIITGSLCVGFDCINGESFGYCTIKLKENNLQICFEDTSVGSFPTNDWKIQINDTTSGGASYFTIWDTDGGNRVFTLEAGAPAHSLYVEDYGRVGLGTSIPYVELHIVDGDTPTLRLDQDGSSGWTPQVWDLAGNETNFFLRDVTNGSKLCFRVQPNTPSNTLCLRSNGYVGIGTWSPAYKFEIETTGEDAMFYLDRTDGAQFKLNVTNAQGQIGTQSSHKLNIVTGNTNRITVDTNGWVGISDTTPDYPLDMGTIGNEARCTTGGVWQNGSSRASKENIRDLTINEAMTALEGLNPVRFNYKVQKDEQYVGFIAEDVPELVATKDRKATSPMDIVAVLTKVVQEQQKVISELNKRITELEKK
jgi:hypothetical protein